MWFSNLRNLFDFTIWFELFRPFTLKPFLLFFCSVQALKQFSIFEEIFWFNSIDSPKTFKIIPFRGISLIACFSQGRFTWAFSKCDFAFSSLTSSLVVKARNSPRITEEQSPRGHFNSFEWESVTALLLWPMLQNNWNREICTHDNHKSFITCTVGPVWPENNCQMAIKLAQKWFY